MHFKHFKTWLDNVTDTERSKLMSIANDEKEIKERFSMPLAFGTAGMRGEVGLGTFRMNIYTVKRATYGLAQFINSLGDRAKNRGVVIAYDTRRFSYDFAFAVAQVLSKQKIKVMLFEGVRPVPMCSYAIRTLNAQAGVMITASHNPKEYNGYKVYGDDGAQMSPENTQEVVNYINKVDSYFSVPADDIFVEDIKGLDNHKINDYITIIGNSIDESYYQEIQKLSLSPEAVKEYGKNIKLVYTPIHGTGYIPVTTILEKIGIKATIVEEQAYPDTEFSTVLAPNPENSDALRMGMELGNKIGADVVIGTDPDCDRMGLAVRNHFTQEYILLNGNQIGVLLLDYILGRLEERGELPINGAVIKTIVTTSLTNKIADKYGATTIDVLTGFKFIGEKIKEWEASNEYTFLFGYEESYGYLRGTHSRDKDAVIASMLTAEMVCYHQSKNKGVYQRLLEIFEEFGYYQEDLASTIYKGIEGMKKRTEAMAKLREHPLTKIGEEEVEYFADYQKGEIRYKNGSINPILLPKTNALYYGLEDGQFVCIRPSGTEPLLKVYVSCKAASMENAKQKAQMLMQKTNKHL